MDFRELCEIVSEGERYTKVQNDRYSVIDWLSSYRTTPDPGSLWYSRKTRMVPQFEVVRTNVYNSRVDAGTGDYSPTFVV